MAVIYLMGCIGDAEEDENGVSVARRLGIPGVREEDDSPYPLQGDLYRR